jgi:hypothetical protein
MDINYTSVTPSPDVSITNSAEPGVGWNLISCTPREEPPRGDIPTLTGIVRAVGLPQVTYQLQYFTMGTIAAGVVLQEDTNGVALTYCGKDLDNVFLVGGGLRIAPAAGGRGILGVTYTQVMAALGQRLAY